jgi:co-chaperonin GroES (HSP10)
MPKGVIITDHRRKRSMEEKEDSPISKPRITQEEYQHAQSAPVEAMQRNDKQPVTQEALMKMVAGRFRPGPKRILVVEDFALQKIGAIHIPQTSQRPATSGRVCAIGSGIEGVKVGDHVVYAIFAGTLLPLSASERVRTLQESEIMVWVNDSAPDTLKLEGEVE